MLEDMGGAMLEIEMMEPLGKHERDGRDKCGKDKQNCVELIRRSS